ncbi:MAG TPA: ATP-binding cassette domain-containing protein [Bacteroidia bacterium]|nr:ATP-binding cassette domain-containing protein [Bacteroidia bacterium]
MSEAILQTNGLSKTFTSGKGKKVKKVEAVKGVDLEVKQGEIFGFLGPNGAGKSTTLNMLTTLSAPTSGKAMVTGFDLLAHPQRVREQIGYVSQAGGADTFANAYENLLLQARLYGISKPDASKKAKELIERFQMTDFADREARTYSGGQKRRLELALGIVHQPKLVFLDEPTTGLDPQSRAYFWEEIKRLKKEGMTIFLTTHYLEEADNLCDRVAIIDHGTIVALGTQLELKRQIGAESIIVEFTNEKDTERAKTLFGSLTFIQKIIAQENKLYLYVQNGEGLIAEVLRVLDKEKIAIQTIGLSRPSLDDVFLQKTGRSLREGKG